VQSIEIRVEDEAVWLTQKLIAELFGVGVRTISEHLRNIFKSDELQESSVIRKLRIIATGGKNIWRSSTISIPLSRWVTASTPNARSGF